MGGHGSPVNPILLITILLVNAYCNPVTISPQTVPDSLVQSAINSLNTNSPTQHTYRGGNLISAQKLLDPNFIVYRLALNLETICAEGSSNCPREACAIDVKDKSGKIEVDQNSIQCMYLYPQSAQEDVQQTESMLQDATVESEDGNKRVSQNMLELDHEVQGATDTQRLEKESPDNQPFIAVRAANSNYCPGCPYELNPNLPGLSIFGAQALDVMDRLGQHDFKYKLIRILKVTRAVPPGSNVVRYELLAEIGESNCLKTTLTERSDCSLQTSIPLRWCLVIFEERPWQQSDRQVVGNNCTEHSDLENEINGGLAVNGARDQPERVDSVQEVIGKTAHIDQLAQEGKIGTYDSLIDEILDSPVSNATPDIAVTDGPSSDGTLPVDNGGTNRGQLFLRSSLDSLRRDADQETNDNRPMVSEAPFVKVKIEREENRPQFHGFVDKQREFDEFLEDFDVPIRDSATVNDNGEGKQAVTEEIIRAQRVGSIENTGYEPSRGTVSSIPEDKSSSSSSESSDSKSEEEYVVNPQRRKRSTRDSDFERLFLKELAQKAIDTLDDIDEDDKKRVVMNIMDSKKEKSRGFLYHLTLEVAPTECKEGNNNVDDQDCLNRISGPIKVCETQVHTDEENSLFSARVVKAECLKRLSRVSENVRNKRAAPFPGAPNSIDVKNKEVQNYAQMGLQKFSQTFQGANEPILIEIISASRQTVQGVLYQIKVKLGTSNCPKGTKENCQLQAGSEPQECNIEAWSRPWLPKDSLTLEIGCTTNDRARRNSRGNVRKRRNTHQVGGTSPISTKDENVINYANLGFNKISEQFQGPNELVLIEIKNATKQVVQGISYTIIVRVGASDCPKGKKENCQLKADSEPQEWEITAWSRPWLSENPLEIKVKCNCNNRRKRSLRGKNYSQKMLEQSTYLKNERLFNEFTTKYNKTYSTISEKKNRFKIFRQNMLMVQELQRNEQGTAVYGPTMFADLTTEEFKKRYLGLKPELRLDNEIPIPMAEIPNIAVPESYDWREYNAVTPVKNQGQCGSCWAFSVTGNVEGQYALRHGSLLSFSEQELVDCDTLDEGCSGGLPDNAYRAIEKLGGLELESDYPYEAEGETCHFNKTEVKVKVVSAVNITSNETQMVQWLVQNGPISIGINANAMQFYVGGVSHPYKFLCSPSNLDHGVLIVGYGVHTYPLFHKTLPYWTIKNSWGPLWGEKGYYRVYRGDGTCGVNQMASSAVVA